MRRRNTLLAAALAAGPTLLVAQAAISATDAVQAAVSAPVPQFKLHGFQGEGHGYVPHFDDRGLHGVGG